MAKDNPTIVTTVTAEGSAESDFDIASFTVMTTKHAKTGAEARESLAPIVAKITRLLDGYGKDIDQSRKRATYSVRPSYEYVKGKARNVGYDAQYIVVFETTNLDRVSEIQDALTKIPDTAVNDPQFGLKDTESLKKIALADAFRRVQHRFATECDVLGEDKDSFEILCWNANYYDQYQRNRRAGMTVVASAASSAADIEVESGKATINVNLSVSYKERSTP